MTVDHFSAIHQTLGYLYQIRYALFLGLSRNEEAQVLVEICDDVSVHEGDIDPADRIQLKHSPAALTDTSPGLWKTLRIWSEGIADGTISVPGCNLILATTAELPAGSIAKCLSEDRTDAARLAETLRSVASDSKNKLLEKSFVAFSGLSEQQQISLVSSVRVKGAEPDIDGIRKRILEQLRIVRPQHRGPVFDRLEGWWLNRVVNNLRANQPLPTSGFEIWASLRDLAEQFHEDSLPIDYEELEPPPEHGSDSDRRVFVLQLRELQIDTKRIQKAVSDYYRAFCQRSRWVRDQLLVGNELENYENRLVDEWERIALARKDRFANTTIEREMRQLGIEILEWMEFDSDFRIRPSVAAPYVRRGTYHMLADGEPPRVHWHPDFQSRLTAIIEKRTAAGE